jgi:glycosyltransferase involved in cell wall biosynthesis
MINTVSFGICTHNEGKYIENLVEQLLGIMRPDDEIVIVDDFSEDATTKKLLIKYDEYKNITIHKRSLNYNFGAQKNFLNMKCNKKWIVNLDADELLSESLALNIHDFIDLNETIDAIWVPRINIVNGLTQEHLAKWGWKIDKEGHINFPDWQMRIYKNVPSIYWLGMVHEVLNGYKNYSFLPIDSKEHCIIHIKDIDRQENQNDKYNKM